ncbi:serine protease [Mucilaginibacter hurinus]|uniref:Serine protease n=1 Tax=Mucilaginibacter hurinus TaxID=2201324 RepID=A0A367GKI9_9SPHI|nr:serine protease [Mucilaginibacter hurinus]RCH53994.1 serine protease [Mucilaginibacter hurinus]
MSDSKLIEAIDRYLSGEMSGEERERFEQLRAENAAVDSQVTEHKHFVGLLKQYGERIELENRLNAIHDEIDVDTLHEDLFIQPTWIVRLWRHHHSKISVAASIAIIAALTTLFFTGKFNSNDSKYELLSREINGVKQNNARQDRINKMLSKELTGVKRQMANPGSYRGTGFALTGNGYIVTNYHVVKDADSVYVQNVDGESFRAKIIYSEPAQDIAFLAINDPAFTPLGTVPYSFKKSKSDLGEDVFTVGYPKDALAFSSGSLTSPEGSNGDTTSYEVSIAARPGNSGGPLLDSRGNLIGILTGKQSRYESMTFARKSSYLLDAIDAIPADSLQKKLSLNTKNALAGLTRTQQIKKLQNYVFMVKVYN